jgi:hypothetical protein
MILNEVLAVHVGACPRLSLVGAGVNAFNFLNLITIFMYCCRTADTLLICYRASIDRPEI